MNKELSEIAALKLPGLELIAGSDTFGSLHSNTRVLDKLKDGDAQGRCAPPSTSSG